MPVRASPWPHFDGRVTSLTLDVTNAAHIQGAVERGESLDILINNAGLALYDDLSDRAAIERHLAVNLFGTYGVTRAFLPSLTLSRGSHRQRSLGGSLCPRADRSGLLDLQGGRVLPVTIAACSFGRTGCERSCRPGRPRGHGYVPRLRRTEGLSRVGCTSHLRRSGERRGGHFPRSHVRVPGGELAQRCGQGARTRVCGPRRSRARQSVGRGGIFSCLLCRNQLTSAATRNRGGLSDQSSPLRR